MVPAKACDTTWPVIGLMARRLAVAQAWFPGTLPGRQDGWKRAPAFAGFQRSGSNAEFISRTS